MLISLPDAERRLAGRRPQADRGRAERALQQPIVSTSVQVVGPTVGKQLEKQAALATLYSLIGMLIYLWFRFELIYGVAAVVAVFHDTLITVGAFFA
jgi:preprotein translocase subunit SecF